MKRLTHTTAPDWYTCMLLSLIVLRRRGITNDPAAQFGIMRALERGERFDERGQPAERSAI